MIVLGLETSGQCGSVALIDGDKVVGFADHNESNAHAERLLPLVNAVMTEARCSRKDISRIAVGIGPGNFTGLRVGISFGQGLGIGLNVPVVGISSLAAMARAVGTTNCDFKLIVRDARKDELFCAAYDNHNMEILAPRLIKRTSLKSCFDAIAEKYPYSREHLTIAGDGLLALDMGQVAKFGAVVAQNAEKLQPNAKHIAYLGAGSNALGWPAPEYVREVDAVLPVLCKNPEIGFRSLS